MNVEGDAAAAQAREGLRLGDFHFDVDRIAKKDRLDEFPLINLAEGDHVRAQNPGLHGQPRSDGQPKNAMRDALTEWRRLRKLGIGMDLVEVTRQTRKTDHIMLGHGAPGRNDLLPGLKILEKQTVIQ